MKNKGEFTPSPITPKKPPRRIISDAEFRRRLKERTLEWRKERLAELRPRIRVEVYLPIRYEAAYQDTLAWIIRQFTELRGGCTVIENASGYYLSQYDQTIDDRVSIVYCDFPVNWAKRAERKETLEYCSELQSFMLRNLWEESVLIAAYPVSRNTLEQVS